MLKVILFIVFFYTVVLLLFFLFQRQLIYFPEQNAPTPKAAGVPEMKAVNLHTKDGLTLKAWYRAPVKKNLPTVAFFHGNAGHIGYRSVFVKPLLDEGFGVLLTTYRGYSGNPGNPTEEGLYNDGRAAIEFIRGQGVSDNCTVLYGNSIGGAVAVQMATEYKIGALILQAPFTSLADVGQHHLPVFPVKYLAFDRFDSASKALKIKVPVFIFYGENDTIIPPVFSRRLYDAFNEPKRIISIPGKDHNDLFEPELVIQFIKETIKC